MKCKMSLWLTTGSYGLECIYLLWTIAKATNWKTYRFLCKVLEPDVAPFLQGIPGATLKLGYCPSMDFKKSFRHLGCRTYTASSEACVFVGYVVYWTCGDFVDWSLQLYTPLKTSIDLSKECKSPTRSQTLKIPVTPCYVVQQYLLKRVMAAQNIDFGH